MTYQKPVETERKFSKARLVLTICGKISEAWSVSLYFSLRINGLKILSLHKVTGLEGRTYRVEIHPTR